jgi:hypothetical protein
LIEYSLLFYFYFVVATNRGISVLPGTRGRSRIAFTAESLLVRGVLSVIGRQQMGEVSIVNVPAMEFLRGRPLEGIGRGLGDKASQELAFAIGQWHD